jgi:colanic acid/amylovoran biosynthesis glycosyltransferase
LNAESARPAPTPTRVALFSTQYLPYSQTFIYEELRHYQRYRPEVFARVTMNLDQFGIEPIHVGEWYYGLTRRSARFDARLRTDPFSLVHGHFGTGSLYAVPFALRHRLPLVVTFHGYDVPLLRSPARWHPKHWPYALLSPQLLRTMTLGLCASEELHSLLVEFGVPADKLVIYRLGVDLARYECATRASATPPMHDAPCGEKSVADGPTVVMIGRLVEKKGFEYGIRAFAAVHPAHPRARLQVIGSGELQGKLRRLVAALDIESYVEFTGALPHQQVAEHLRRASILMAPSVTALDGNRESGVLVVKEASASGIPCIGTYHGGIHEIIEDGVAGLLVPERSVHALSRALDTLLTDPELRVRMGKAARAHMERDYDIRARVQELELLYDHAIQRHARTTKGTA